MLSLLVLVLLTGFENRSQAVEQRVFDAINHERQAHGLPALRWSNRIALQARYHSARMLAKGFFSHQDPKFGGTADRLSIVGIPWRMCGENIFQEQGYSDPVRAAVEGWMQSPGHRQNILTKRFTDTGIGVQLGKDGTYMMTQIFAAF